MITREGMETALLMTQLIFTVKSTQVAAGAIAGTAAAACIAWLWSRYGYRVNLARFFQVTAVFLLVFVVQLLIYGFHELTEANIFPAASRCTTRPNRTGPTACTASTSPTCSCCCPSPGSPSRASFVAESRRGRRRHSAMADQVTPDKPRPLVELVWEHDLVFAGHSGAVKMTLDSASAAGPSPMQALAFALAGCMAMDVVHVIKKGRYDLRGLRADLSGTRAPTDPHRFTAIALHFTVNGDVAGRKDRARDRIVARQVLLRVAFHAPGHRLQVTHTVTTGV